MYVLSNKARVALAYLQSTDGKDQVGKEVAQAIDLDGRVVTGVLNGLAKATKAHPALIYREKVGDKNFVRLTDEGRVYDVDTLKPEEEA